MHPHPISPDDISERQRTLFWAKVHKTPTCWLWTGCINGGGYGQLVLYHSTIRRHVKAHRVAYTYDKNYQNKKRSCSICTNARHKADYQADKERRNAAARARYYADHERRLAIMRAKREAKRKAKNRA